MPRSNSNPLRRCVTICTIESFGSDVSVQSKSEIPTLTVKVGIGFLEKVRHLCTRNQKMDSMKNKVTQLFRETVGRQQGRLSFFCAVSARSALGSAALAVIAEPGSKCVGRTVRGAVGGLRNRIVAAAAPGVAFGQTAQGEPQPLEGAVFAQRFEGVLRAGGGKAARGRRERRDTELVEAHQPDQGQGTDPLTDAPRPIPESCGRHWRRFYTEAPPSTSRSTPGPD